MIFLSLILDMMLTFGIGLGAGDMAAVNGNNGDNGGIDGGHTVHGHVVQHEHHGRHGHIAGPSGHEPGHNGQNPS